jgi:hypothetical protein
MVNDHDDQERKLIEKVLEQLITQIFVRLKLGLADWDFNAKLRSVLQEPIFLNEIKDLLEKYDKTFDKSIKSNLQINEKYKTLYKLIK